MTSRSPTRPPWPYPFVLATQREPSWDCPGGICVCHPNEEQELKELYVLLLDHLGAPMKDARCLVEANGFAVKAPSNANEHGWLTIVTRAAYETISIAWAPKSVPLEETYPYFHRYYVGLKEEDPEEATKRRLSNLGFFHRNSLAANVTDYERCHFPNQSATGDWREVKEALVQHHDFGRRPGDEDAREQVKSFLQADADPPAEGDAGTPEYKGNPPVDHGSAPRPGHGSVGLALPPKKPRLRISAWVTTKMLAKNARTASNPKWVVVPERMRHATFRLDDVSVLRTIKPAIDTGATIQEIVWDTKLFRFNGRWELLLKDRSTAKKKAALEAWEKAFIKYMNDFVDAAHAARVQCLVGLGITNAVNPTVHARFEAWLKKPKPSPSPKVVADMMLDLINEHLPKHDGLSADIEFDPAKGAGKRYTDAERPIVKRNLKELYQALAERLATENQGLCDAPRILAIATPAFVSREDMHFLYADPDGKTPVGSLKMADMGELHHFWDIVLKTTPGGGTKKLSNIIFRPMGYMNKALGGTSSFKFWHRDIIRFFTSEIDPSQLQLGIATSSPDPTDLSVLTTHARVERRIDDLRKHEAGVAFFPQSSTFWSRTNTALNYAHGAEPAGTSGQPLQQPIKLKTKPMPTLPFPPLLPSPPPPTQPVDLFDNLVGTWPVPSWYV